MNYNKILNVFAGYTTVEVSSQYPERFLNIAMKANLNIWNIRKVSGTVLRFDIRSGHRAFIGGLARNTKGVTVSFWQRGLPKLFLPYRKRYGMMAGAAVGLFFIFLSTFYVWSVKIIGNETIADHEIAALLRESGFGEGSCLTKINLDRIRSGFLERNPEISFLSINLKGTVANVEVHERDMPRLRIDTKRPYNLIADHDGQILSLEVVNGETVVKAGEAVMKGQLLVSGIVDSNIVGYRIVHAEGKVFARTYRTAAFSIPLIHTEKRYTGEEAFSRRFRVLGRYFGWMAAPGFDNYDVITVEEPLTVLGAELPIHIEKTLYAEYDEGTRPLRENEARNRVYDLYHSWRDTVYDHAVILNERIEYEFDEQTVRLVCEVEAIENIAVEQKFYTSRQEE